MPKPPRSKERAVVYLHRSLIAICFGLAGSAVLTLILGKLLHRDPLRWNPHDGALLAVLALILMCVAVELIGIVASTYLLWRHSDLRDRRKLCILALGVVGVSAIALISAHPPGYFIG